MHRPRKISVSRETITGWAPGAQRVLSGRVGDVVDDFAESKVGRSAGAQTAAAVVLVAVVVGGMWGPGIFRQQPADSEPATCSSTHDTLASQYVSAAQLCAALNRPDPPTLLETPEDHTRTAGGNGDWITLAGGARTAAPEANVVLQTYSVKLSASYDHLPVTQAADPPGDTGQTRTVLGHPAVLYSDRTIALTFTGSRTTTGPGNIARRLLVARNAKDGGGSFEIVIRRQDDMLPDDAALVRVAEKVLPTIPG